MKKLLLTLILPLCFSLLAGRCNNNDDCTWTPINALTLTEQLKDDLNDVFSNNNMLLNSIKGDFLIYVIDSEQDFFNVSNNAALASLINFESQYIVWGRLLTSSISNSILSKQLFACNSSYSYKVVIDKCTDCWEALGYLYFWDIYSTETVPEDILLTIK